LEELLRLFDPPLGIMPVVHRRTSPDESLKGDRVFVCRITLHIGRIAKQGLHGRGTRKRRMEGTKARRHRGTKARRKSAPARLLPPCLLPPCLLPPCLRASVPPCLPPRLPSDFPGPRKYGNFGFSTMKMRG